ncbi:murein hydrolase activator EnvC family protein [Gaoshiqia sediminis]|uniref:Peptidoglycan DD-metalloendopeptidase family protein n=1 Tax=Gaoshiqia sediminis TaxID=2986998 RepID=A0AA41Y5E7_9BACT|nr:M23 family metallopeptidase [Gaoshiqia sediminis]MCW0481447.1 peptidoglycan DD-metalloendopeptidase family protein [Gaoshiqia sediminis]
MKRLVFGFVFVLALWSAQGQSLTDLRKKKTDAEQALKYTSSLLEEARKHEKASLNKLRLINSQIQTRNDFIGNINVELNIIDRYIAENTEVVNMLKSDLDELKKEYASMVRFAQKNKNSYDVLLFLLSADNLNQAYKRFLYLRQYAKYRKAQAEIITSLSGLIDQKISSLEKQRQQKANLLLGKREETKLLENEKREQDQYLSSLKLKQQDLRKKLREQEKEQEELNRAIQRMLEEETRKMQAKGEFQLTPEQQLVAADFEKNKGRIPWPVERGVITGRFGVHAHPVLKQIQVKNNGIDISTRKGTPARAVFGGEVSRVFAISGGNMAVIIRHGSFLSVYSNLKEVFVNAGQKVEIKQEIGSVFTDESDGNKTVLKFQVWKESQKLNPEDWITH